MTPLTGLSRGLPVPTSNPTAWVEMFARQEFPGVRAEMDVRNEMDTVDAGVITGPAIEGIRLKREREGPANLDHGSDGVAFCRIDVTLVAFHRVGQRNTGFDTELKRLCVKVWNEREDGKRPCGILFMLCASAPLVPRPLKCDGRI
jgi:hypothetical protein